MARKHQKSDSISDGTSKEEAKNVSIPDATAEEGHDLMHESPSDPTKHGGVTKLQAKGGENATKLFPLVGIGASAGGLAALKNLFDRIPADTGLAFVIVV